jgi:hypothetical protein
VQKSSQLNQQNNRRFTMSKASCVRACMKKKLNLNVLGGGVLATGAIFIALAASGVGAAIAWAIGAGIAATTIAALV